MKKTPVYDLITVALMAALITVCSWITVPLSLVSFTMQTFAIFFALEFLGGKKGTLAIALYILLGAVGLPVFAGFRGGFGHLMGATGGYIVGFLLTGLLYILTEKLMRKSIAMHILLLAVCHIACYALGTVWFVYVYKTGFGGALMMCVVPFILPDAVKIALAVLLGGRVRKALHRA